MYILGHVDKKKVSYEDLTTKMFDMYYHKYVQQNTFYLTVPGTRNQVMLYQQVPPFYAGFYYLAPRTHELYR